MTSPVPNLDDRTFAELVQQAREHAARVCPEWTDRSVHDPGMVLIEAFAYLTEVMLYRLNRLPEKAYVEFLNLLGVARHPPAAAWADLRFTRVGPATGRVVIPAGTRVAVARPTDPEQVVFSTATAVAIEPDQTDVTVRAHHGEPVAGELLGIGTGAPGQVLRAARAPIVSANEPYDVMLGVAVPDGHAADGVAAREFDGVTYELWQPVPTFAGAAPTDRVYLLDRSTGTATFAPALDTRHGDADPDRALAAVPEAGRQIRLWYRIGGGPDGNVAADTLTALRDPVPGVTVTNPEPARGGRPLEAIESALARGPYEFFSQQRAITARDFELLATASSGAVARARAFTRTSVWSFGQPGEVEVVLVPDVAAQARPGWRLPVEALTVHQGPDVLAATQQELDGRRALGTSVVTTWARYKPVSVRGRAVVRAQEDPDAVRQRIHERLYQTISPLPTPATAGGWAFGEPLRASNVYRLLEQAEPGVSYVDEVRFVVEAAPDTRVRAAAVDAFQPDTWYAGCDEVLFRSTNGAVGWEPVGRFPGEEVRRVVPAPAAQRAGIVARPGAVALVTRAASGGSRIYLSTDLGERWTKLAELEPAVTSVAWVDREDAGALLLATDAGLYELSLLPGSVPLQVLVDPSDPDRGFYAVCSFVSERGVGLALAAQARYGVYLSLSGGHSNTFRHVGLSNVDTRTLAVQYDGPATLLWAGTGEADAQRPGDGCHRARLFEADVRWQPLSAGWTGGTCWDLTFAGTTALAASQSAGVLALDSTAATPVWRAPDVNCGLPLRDRTRFEPVEAVVATRGDQVVAGTARGVYRRTDPDRWAAAANRETRQAVTVPDTWLLCSGEHDIEVVRDA
jgi:hypothetical protein